MRRLRDRRGKIWGARRAALPLGPGPDPDNLSFTHRKEMANAIREAKKEETKQRRLDKAMSLLRDRQKPS